MYKCVNKSIGNVYHLEQMVDNFFPYSQEKLGFDKSATIVFQSDEDNSMKMLGKTAYYDPQKYEIALYVDGRHPKDILRSLSHELVHHAQNCRGDFQAPCETDVGYAQRDPHLRKMEREAYTKGNLIFRDFEDLIKTGKITIDIDFKKSGEPEMSLKEWKDNELNSLLMKKWGLLKEGAGEVNEGIQSYRHEDEGRSQKARQSARKKIPMTGFPRSRAHPGVGCDEAHPDKSHKEFMAGLRGQATSRGDERGQKQLADPYKKGGEMAESRPEIAIERIAGGLAEQGLDPKIDIGGPASSPGELKQQALTTRTQVPELTKRERIIQQWMHAATKAMTSQGEQVTQRAILHLQRFLEEIGVEAPVPDAPGAEGSTPGVSGVRISEQPEFSQISVREAKEITRRIVERVKKESK